MCISSKFCGFHIFVTQRGKFSKMDSKLIRDGRFLDLVNVLVSIYFLLPKYKLDLVSIMQYIVFKIQIYR